MTDRAGRRTVQEGEADGAGAAGRAEGEGQGAGAAKGVETFAVEVAAVLEVAALEMEEVVGEAEVRGSEEVVGVGGTRGPEEAAEEVVGWGPEEVVERALVALEVAMVVVVEEAAEEMNGRSGHTPAHPSVIPLKAVIFCN